MSLIFLKIILALNFDVRGLLFFTLILCLMISLKFLKDVGSTADDFRAGDNSAIRWASRNGHLDVLKFLKDTVGLTATDFFSA